jgi:hypothetical protein
MSDDGRSRYRRLLVMMRRFFPLLIAVVSGCGARSALEIPEPKPDVGVDTTPPPDCVKNEDCEGFEDKCAPVACSKGKCIAGPKVVCDDKDPCTEDSCEPTTGKCSSRALTLDLDGDGHKGPLPGHKAGDPGSCGDDCDDRSDKAFPGNKEVCDGVDNDCNGVVDDDMIYLPVDPTKDAVQISEAAMAPAGPAGLAFTSGGGESYLACYNGREGTKTRVFGALLDPNGKKTLESRVTNVTVDAMEGRVVWTGGFYGVAWSDRRDGSWEIYFNRLNKKMEKLGGDLKLSEHETWSINLAMQWTGTEFALAWQDQRDLDPDFGIYGQRVDVDGKPIGGNVKLTDGQGGSPELAVGTGSIALAYTETIGRKHDVRVGIYSRELKELVPSFAITTKTVSGAFPVIIWNNDRYVVAFYDPDSTVHAVWGATFDESGKILTPLTKITDSPKFSRYPSILPLGDRVILVWSDTKDSAGGYELYSKMLDKNLAPLGSERRITQATGDSIFPIATFGPTGDVGVLFRDDRLGALHTYFTRLVCQAR